MSTCEDRPPTARQLEILRFIFEYTKSNGYPPRFTEIGEAAGIASLNGVNDHLKLIERRGLIRRERGQARSIVVTTAGVAVLGIEAA